MAANGRALLAAVDENAAAAGLAPGMVLADARALVPDLAVRPSHPDKDAAALAQLADWCARFSPWVGVDGADGLFLDITGCAHLFGGEARMMEDIAQRLMRFGYRARLAIADTPGSAWAAARFATLARDSSSVILPPGGTREAMAGLPVAALRLSPLQTAELERLGLKLVADLYPLPRAALLRRFGVEPGRRLDQALGRIEEPINPRLPASPHETRLAFPEPIVEASSIASALDRMLAGLCRHLASEQLGVRQMRLALFRVDGSLQRFSVGTSRPNRDPQALRRLFANLFERLDPGFGIEAMTLTATQAEPLEDLQLVLAQAQARAQTDKRTQAERQNLAEVQGQGSTPAAYAARASAEPLDEKAIERAVDEAALAALADLFANARFANEAAPVRLTRPVPQESHLPERAVRPAPAMAAGGESWSAMVQTTVRPVRLLSRPEPLETDEAESEALPAFFRWRARPHRIRLAEGPERIAPEWWRPAASGEGARDYYRVEDSEGRRFWLYRELEASRWYLHGLFA